MNDNILKLLESLMEPPYNEEKYLQAMELVLLSEVLTKEPIEGLKESDYILGSYELDIIAYNRLMDIIDSVL